MAKVGNLGFAIKSVRLVTDLRRNVKTIIELTNATFCDQRGKRVDLDSWCNVYRPLYFLAGPKYGRKINARNQTSPYIEAECIRILNKTNPPDHQDLKFIFGWKLGQIDHKASEEKQQIIYKLAWAQRLVAQMRFNSPDFSPAISWLGQNMRQIVTLRPEAVFDLHHQLKDVGPVYILTFLFFLRHGRWPIYDQYAAVAVDAIMRGLAPGSRIPTPQLSSWRSYEAFVMKIREIFGCQAIPREQDQALWVYGHFFNTQQTDGKHV